MDIYQILRKEHREVQRLLEEQIEHREEGDKDLDLSEIHKQLKLHMQGEERIFYPLLEKNETSRDETLESYEEHHVANTVLDELMKLSPDDDRWLAKLKVLNELVNHHVEEEEKILFKVSRKVLDAKKAQQIGEEFRKEKEKKMGMKK